MNDSFFLETAGCIGQRITRQALWQGRACTWRIAPSDVLASPGESLASGALYQGTAGIALFLGELYRLTEDETYRHTAEGALRHALAHAQEMPPDQFGFYTGRVGIAYAAARLAAVLQTPAYRQQARAVLTPLAGHEQQDTALDVIAGSAGAIPALLELADMLDDDALIEQAAALGEHVIRTARQGPLGWSWRTLAFPSARNLTGQAHGASGFGYALLELYRATASDRWLYAAEQAFRYERHCYDAEASNWPDYRRLELGSYYYSGQFEALRLRLQEGGVPDYAPRYVNAWCYGAPGIGLARLRAYELLGHDAYAREARAAVETTRAALAEPDQSYALCHGIAGNCETLLYAAEVFDAPELRAQAEAEGLRGAERYEQTNTPWPCGTMEGAADPSLMLGEAGIGYFYLRLYNPETPSLLLLRPSTTCPQAASPGPVASASLRQAYTDAFFGNTLRAMDALPGIATAQLTTLPLDIGRKESDVSLVYGRLCAVIAAQDDPLRSLLEDVFRPERLRYEMMLALTDFSAEFLDAVRRIPPEDLAWPTVTVALAPSTRLVQCRWDWEGWLDQDQRPPAPTPATVSLLLYRHHNQIHRRTLSPLAALVFSTIATPTSLRDLLTRVLGAMAGPTSEAQHTLQRQVIALLRQSYQLGLIHCEPQPALVSSS